MRALAFLYAVVLLAAGLLNQAPGITDAEGRVFGIFELDLFDDLLHLASAAWAGLAAAVSRRAAITFLRVFGLLYLADGVLGLATGSGYLDLGILVWGVQDLPLMFRIMANTPHLLLGGIAALAGWRARA
jgi:Domain of unknown function (DUF4383)